MEKIIDPHRSDNNMACSSTQEQLCIFQIYASTNLQPTCILVIKLLLSEQKREKGEGKLEK
jgi:hypothetical protein